MGNERVLAVRGRRTKLRLTRPPDVRDAAGTRIYLRAGRPVFLRLLEGRRIGNVFLQNIRHIPPGACRTVRGTPSGNAKLVDEISRDRDLPAINDVVPARGAPMVLYSTRNKTLYLVARIPADLPAVEDALAQVRP